MPLSSTAVAVLRALSYALHGDVFPSVTTEAVKRSYMRAIRRAAIKDLRFHYLRYEATTRLFEKGLNIMEVASITGHKGLRMLRRYTHLKSRGPCTEVRMRHGWREVERQCLLHLRDGDMLAAVLPDTTRRFARAIVMPNLKRPVRRVSEADAYPEVHPSGPASRNGLRAADEPLPDGRHVAGRSLAGQG